MSSCPRAPSVQPGTLLSWDETLMPGAEALASASSPVSRAPASPGLLAAGHLVTGLPSLVCHLHLLILVFKNVELRASLPSFMPLGIKPR